MDPSVIMLSKYWTYEWEKITVFTWFSQDSQRIIGSVFAFYKLHTYLLSVFFSKKLYLWTPVSLFAPFKYWSPFVWSCFHSVMFWWIQRHFYIWQLLQRGERGAAFEEKILIKCAINQRDRNFVWILDNFHIFRPVDATRAAL